MATTLEEHYSQMLASMLYSAVRTAIAAGSTPTMAYRLASFALIEGVLGREATKALGLKPSTQRLWRAELADLAAKPLEEDQLLGLAHELVPLVLRDLRKSSRWDES